MCMPANSCSFINSHRSAYKNSHAKGFTLVELIVGIVLFSIAMVTIVSVIMPQIKNGIDPIMQVRSVTLAQSLLSEISAKAFDEASLSNNGRVTCNHTTSCTSSAALGWDANESRQNFDDVDDYHGLALSGVAIANASEASVTALTEDLFLGFSAKISVVYDDNADGINDDDINNDGTLDSGTLVGNRKLISVVVTTPAGEQMVFATYRNNF